MGRKARTCFEVDVLPPKGSQLLGSPAGEKGDDHVVVQAVRRSLGQHVINLLRRQRLRRSARAPRRYFGELNYVALHQITRHRTLHCAVQAGMNSMQRLGTQLLRQTSNESIPGPAISLSRPADAFRVYAVGQPVPTHVLPQQRSCG